MSGLKKTPLFTEHEKQNGKLIDFVGWNLPIQYQGLKEEHLCVRNHVGLFDVSHMGEIRIKGLHCLEAVEWLTTNHVASLEDNCAQYSLLPNKTGGLVDDLIVYCLKKEQDYLLCVNAANKEKDLAWILENNKNADIVDESDFWAQIAVQGPKAPSLLNDVFSFDYDGSVSPFHFVKKEFNGFNCIIARTGYTGEDGGEIFIPKEGAVQLWQCLLEKGHPYHVQPIGLGARDTLRLEAKLCLYGNEIDETTNPYEATLNYFIKPKHKDFIGKDPIISLKESGLKRKLIGFELIDRGIPRHGYKIFSTENENNEIGYVTSGTHSPSLNKPIGLAYVPVELAKIDTEFLVEIRSKKVKAKVIKTPFINK